MNAILWCAVFAAAECFFRANASFFRKNRVVPTMDEQRPKTGKRAHPDNEYYSMEDSLKIAQKIRKRFGLASPEPVPEQEWNPRPLPKLKDSTDESATRAAKRGRPKTSRAKSARRSRVAPMPAFDDEEYQTTPETERRSANSRVAERDRPKNSKRGIIPPTPDKENRLAIQEHQPTPETEKTHTKSRAAEKRPKTSRAKSAKRSRVAPIPADDDEEDRLALDEAYLDVLSWPEATDELQIPTTRSRKRKKSYYA